MTLLTADWHLTDKPEDAYRWNIFKEIRSCGIKKLFILGDVTDRKDRHSAALVNRLVNELIALRDAGFVIHIIMGNHDMPLNGTPFWSFLREIQNIFFHTEPKQFPNGLLLIPYSPQPSETFPPLFTKKPAAAFMHQPSPGVIGDNGHRLDIKNFPKLPKIPIYSGDIHTPQVNNGITYVGAPYPIDFGDDYKCRMLVLDSDFKIEYELEPKHPRKAVLNVTSFADIKAAALAAGDMCRIRFTMPQAAVEVWPATEERIRAYAASANFTIASLECIISSDTPRDAKASGDHLSDPLLVLQEFAQAEGLDNEVMEVGMALLKEEIDG